ncbi:MAG TPA: cyclic pyranopterin monophosphate synthase MoaC [Fibrobacteria bacterium]|nr:cyclic pyranopterin monophosphate synthase MoaC [Fibrobacteria bacterium]
MAERLLTHLDDRGLPGMVDVTGKSDTTRTARAQSRVRLPGTLRELFQDGEIRSPKGAVMQTAILAGTMAAKRTSDLIPLCHPLPLGRVKFETRLEHDELVIECECACHGPTGVEMEALTGATVAALTVYDMGKAISHEIEIRATRLLWKTGGKSGPAACTAAPLKGLVLAGGASRRMGQDKANLSYGERPAAARAFDLLSGFCSEVRVARAPDQEPPVGIPSDALLRDRFLGLGPLGGILTALTTDRDSAWLVIACDLPLLSRGTLEGLLRHRDPSVIATAYLDPSGIHPEPLCAIWEPSALPVCLSSLAEDRTCPRRILASARTRLLSAPGNELANANTPAERAQLLEVGP